MALDPVTANELAWAIEATKAPPYVTGPGKRQVAVEYGRIHRLLRDIDRAERGWTIDKLPPKI